MNNEKDLKESTEQALTIPVVGGSFFFLIRSYIQKKYTYICNHCIRFNNVVI